MKNQRKDLKEAARLFAIGGFLLAVVFLAPDFGNGEHGSFFSIAHHSTWSHLFDWPAAWCSAKIILLSIAFFCFLDAMFCLLIETEFHVLYVAVLGVAILPVLLLFFGFYEFARAVF